MAEHCSGRLPASASLTSPGGDGNHPWPHVLVAALDRFVPTRFVLAQLTAPQLAAAEGTVPPAHPSLRQIMAQRSEFATSMRASLARRELRPRPQFSMQLYTNGLLPSSLLDAIVTDSFLANVVEANLPNFEWDSNHLRLSLHREADLVRSCSRVYVPSEELASDASERFGVGDAVVAVGVGPVIEPYGPSTRKLGRRILFIGSDAERKGLGLALDAFAAVQRRHEDAELHLVGREAKAVGPGIHCHGHVDARKPEGRDRMSAIIGSANLMVLPTRFDPVGFASLDAMAHGIPIVAPRSGMLKQFVEEGVTGIHCELDAGSIAAAILQCLDDPAKCDWMGREARKRQRSLFTWEAAAGRLLDDWARTSALR